MKYNFDEMIDRTQAASIKWAVKQRERMFGEKDILPMGIADMDFQTAPAIARAVQKRAGHETYGYCYPSDEFLQACVDWQRRRNGWEIRPDWIVFTPGVNMALVCAVEMYAAPGDQVIIQSPVYYPYYDYVEKTGRKIVLNALVNRGGHYEINFEELEELARDPQTKVMLFCSPHNPVGRAWTREELERVGRICIDNGVMLAVDEIHSDLIFHGKHHTVTASISPEIANRIITCVSATKTFNLAGLQASTTIFPNAEMKQTFDKFWQGLEVHRNNAFSSVAMEAAYREGEEWLEQLLEYISGNFDYVCDYCAKYIPKIKPNRPDATYLMWLDCRDLNMTNEELRDFFIYKAKLGLNEGYTFGRSLSGYMRLNVACPRATLEKAMDQLKAAVDAL